MTFIEQNPVMFTEAQMEETPIEEQNPMTFGGMPALVDEIHMPALVGEIQTNTSQPSLELTSSDNYHSVEFGRSTKFQITAVVKVNGKEGHKKADLTGTATLTQGGYYHGYRDQVDQSVKVKKDTNANRWTVTLSRLMPGNYWIQFTAQGSYGNDQLYSNYDCEVQVNENTHV